MSQILAPASIEGGLATFPTVVPPCQSVYFAAIGSELRQLEDSEGGRVCSCRPQVACTRFRAWKAKVFLSTATRLPFRCPRRVKPRDGTECRAGLSEPGEARCSRPSHDRPRANAISIACRTSPTLEQKLHRHHVSVVGPLLAHNISGIVWLRRRSIRIDIVQVVSRFEKVEYARRGPLDEAITARTVSRRTDAER